MTPADAARPAETVSETAPARHETPDVAELRRLAEAATPGPWWHEWVDGDDWWAVYGQPTGDMVCPEVCTTWSSDEAAYIAAVNPAEVERLTGMLAGRCLSDLTHRDEDRRQSFCMLPADHAPLAHDDCMGCTWTDADHWQPQAVDRLADELRAVADESQREGWDSPAVRRVIERLSVAFDDPSLVLDGEGE